MSFDFLILSFAILFAQPAFASSASNHIFDEKKALNYGVSSLRKDSSLQQLSCPTNSCKVVPQDTKGLQILQEKSTQKVDELQQNKELQDFQQELLLKKDPVLENKEFQEFVSELQEKASNVLPVCQDADRTNIQISQDRNPEKYNSEGRLYIFVSFSLGEKALLNLAHESHRYGAIFVLRGFKDGSYAKTVRALQKIILETGQGIIIDPELFNLFSVSSVPTFILAKPFSPKTFERTATPFHDRLQGHASVNYALETFAKEGDFQDEAKAFLEKGMVK